MVLNIGDRVTVKESSTVPGCLPSGVLREVVRLEVTDSGMHVWLRPITGCRCYAEVCGDWRASRFEFVSPSAALSLTLEKASVSAPLKLCEFKDITFLPIKLVDRLPRLERVSTKERDNLGAEREKQHLDAVQKTRAWIARNYREWPSCRYGGSVQLSLGDNYVFYLCCDRCNSMPRITKVEKSAPRMPKKGELWTQEICDLHSERVKRTEPANGWADPSTHSPGQQVYEMIVDCKCLHPAEEVR